MVMELYCEKLDATVDLYLMKFGYVISFLVYVLLINFFVIFYAASIMK